ncbi:MAG: putative quinol monooxygenase [Steroidobacteraceae bacterium]
MDNKIVRFSVSLSIAEGKFEAFEKLAEAMLAATRRNPGARGFDWYLSSDRQHCRLLETYANADAVIAQIQGPVVHEFIPKMLAVGKLNSFEVFGEPGPKATALLAGFGAAFFAPWHLF